VIQVFIAPMRLEGSYGPILLQKSVAAIREA
jgi:hypothetical protein